MRVAVVEERELYAEVLMLALRVHRHQVVRIAPPPQDHPVDVLTRSVVETAPDAVLLDLELDREPGGEPGGGGAAEPDGAGGSPDLVGELSRRGIRVVVLTASQDRALWGRCLAHGAARVVPRTAPLQDVVSTLRRLELGLPVMARGQRKALVEAWERAAS